MLRTRQYLSNEQRAGQRIIRQTLGKLRHRVSDGIDVPVEKNRGFGELAMKRFAIRVLFDDAITSSLANRSVTYVLGRFCYPSSPQFGEWTLEVRSLT